MSTDSPSSSDSGPHFPEALAVFGQARLMKSPDHQYELLGGSPSDRAQALHWISLFMTNHPVAGLTPEELSLLQKR
jgi:hypothetical protein